MTLIEQLVATVKPVPENAITVMNASQVVMEFRTVGYRTPRQSGMTESVVEFANARPDQCAIVVADTYRSKSIQGKLTAGTPVSVGRTFGRVVNTSSDVPAMPGVKYLIIDDATHTLAAGQVSQINLGYWAAEALDEDAIIILIG